MSYICELCNYTAKNSSNFINHKKTAKHKLQLQIKSLKRHHKIDKSTSNTSESTLVYTKIADPNNGYNCKNCDFITAHKSSYYRHLKICQPKETIEKVSISELKLKLEFSEREKEFIKKIEEEKSAMLKEKTEFINNFMANANTLLNKANDNTKVTAEAMKSVSISALKYANDKFTDAPALLPLENFSINNLSFDNENDRKQLTEILVYNAKQKSLDKLLGDHIVKEYKKDNPEEQSFHTTDCSRLNYIVRDLIENALIWSMDKSGIKICTSIVKPLIEKCINLLLEHQKDLIEEMSTGNLKNKETVKTIISVLMSIDRGSLESDINKYIAPFFNLNKNS
jgi:hypothetical protein